jgi:predicted DCC family thiol-disulfide oxidoreductase YuxK
MIPSLKINGDISVYDLRTREARSILKNREVDFVNMNTIYCITQDEVLNKSRAVFAIFSNAKSGYRFFSFFRKLPVKLTDKVYDFVARHRYSISKGLRSFKIIK